MVRGWRGWRRETLDQVAHALMGAGAAGLYLWHPLAGVLGFMGIAFREGTQRWPAKDRPYDPFLDWFFYCLGASLCWWLT